MDKRYTKTLVSKSDRKCFSLDYHANNLYRSLTAMEIFGGDDDVITI